MADNDILSFAADDDPAFQSTSRRRPCQKPWKVMIVDDEPEVHTITRLALSGLEYEGRPLEFVSAFSGKEAKALIEENMDTAIVFLDVVMEAEDAGLDVAHHIRDNANNRLTRIILRTGHPGQVPERRVIVEYDINDYKTKTELTAQKLFTAVVSGLRAYADLVIIERNRRGLEQIVRASASFLKAQSMRQFVQGALTQLVALMRLGENAFCCDSGCFVTEDRRNYPPRIVAGIGEYDGYAGQPAEKVLPAEILASVRAAIGRRGSVFTAERIVLFFASSGGRGNIIYLEGGAHELNAFDKELLSVFCANVAAAFDNINMIEELERTRREIVRRVGAVAETRSEETGNHVHRVAEYCYLLGQMLGMGEADSQMLKEAAPMHDIGKVGIPDAILNKPGKLTPEEFEVMKRHAEIGYKLLSGSRGRLLDVSATIAHEHHERYAGGGYPRNLKGEDISLFGRIVAVADVFDALSSPRCYKPAWDLDKTFAYLEEQRGRQFDPQLIDLFLANRDEVLRIRESLKD
ncbi:MAG: DUF3369 domain-containing protein [Candidatus Accumulibacter sp.]|jgi:response regulator RpfG family c-di-GMP phosphodiesterase|nr:DUF3369 domain-containing protein [Accumulibacter sp.]